MLAKSATRRLLLESNRIPCGLLNLAAVPWAFTKPELPLGSPATIENVVKEESTLEILLLLVFDTYISPLGCIAIPPG